ncbi:hypothetical protein ACUNWD_02810 [Sunxiuqinia sp. A32]|uniref:hypothetical protein n=1 Tax=Sunxiuqinia sp. A32 TaxID=3461496 RepID=UPI0040467F13
MNRKLNFLLATYLLLSIVSYGQKVNGYIINNDGARTECIVTNTGVWEAVDSYEYRIPDEKTFNAMDLAKIKEFGIYNEVKCVRELIQIDRSDERIKRAEDAQKEPKWDEGHAYLNVLYEGELASLYSFYEEGKTYFYYRTGPSTIELLYHKKYLVEVTPGLVENTIENNTYKQQLIQAFKIEDESKLRKLTYTKNSLVRFFDNYHKEHFQVGENMVASNPKPRITVRALLNRNSFSSSIQDFNDSELVYFKEEKSLGYGLEVEYNFAFNHNRLAVFAGANYASYYSDYTDYLLRTTHDGYIWDYYSIDIPFGVRYYLQLFPKGRIYAEMGASPNFILDKSELILNSDFSYSFDSAIKTFFGIGLSYGRLAIETRLFSDNNITQNLYKRGSKQKQWTVSVQYDIFRHTFK